jgi:hypothetical protein
MSPNSLRLRRHWIVFPPSPLSDARRCWTFRLDARLGVQSMRIEVLRQEAGVSRPDRRSASWSLRRSFHFGR